MKAYIGAKVLKAEPCTRGEFLANDSADEGYRVQYPDGYVSWSPKATFEQAYRALDIHERAFIAGAL